MIEIEDAPSPNFDERTQEIDMLVLHYTGMDSADLALERMRDPEAKVSSHYMVYEDGRIVRLVPERLRAWHAGLSRWQGDEDLNSRSIGIEIANKGHNILMPDGSLEPYPDAQIESVMTLCKSILRRHAIPASRIVGHSDITPPRKTDPGEHFPWRRLADSGIGLWPAALDNSALMGRGIDQGENGEAAKRLQSALAEIGYDIEQSGRLDAKTMEVVRAFQRRFVQEKVDGLVDLKTALMIEAVRALYSSSSSSSLA